MHTTHKEQIAFLKKKLKPGLKGKDLFTLYKEKFCPGIKSYELRVTAVRAELNIGKKPAINRVLVNIVDDEKDPLHEAGKMPTEIPQWSTADFNSLKKAEKTRLPPLTANHRHFFGVGVA